MTKILAICINYHDEENTVRFVTQLLEQRESEYLEIIVTDTSNRNLPDPNLDLLQKNDNRVSVFTAGKNLGYFGAAQWTLSRYLETKELPTWMIVSNTDMFFCDRNLLSDLFLLDDDNETGVIAPSIISARTGLDQNPHMIIKPSRSKVLLRKYLLKNYTVYRTALWLYALKQFIKTKIEDREPIDKLARKAVYAAHGSFIILSARYFSKGGTLHYRPFLFGEEYFIAERAKSLGLKIVYEPKLVVFHDEHRTTGQSLNRTKWHYLVEANSFCLETYYENDVSHCR